MRWGAIPLLLACSGALAQGVGFLPLAEGNVSLVRGAIVHAAVEGMRVQDGDILATAANSQAHIQLTDGSLLNLGPGTRLMVMRVPPARGESEVAMLSGWLKVSQKKANPPRPFRYYLPNAQVTSENATAVIRADAGLVEAFVETGAIRLGAPLQVNSGEFVRLKSGQAAATAPRASREFVKAMPRHFKDSLPVLADKLKDRRIEPKRERDVAYADVEDWMKAAWPVRRGFVRRFQGRAGNPEFRAALVRNLRYHPEWDRTLFPEKYETEEKK